MMIRVSLFALVFCMAGCGSSTPAPDYPEPVDPAIEETSLGQYIEDESADEAAEEDDSWDHPTEGEATDAPVEETD